MVAAMTVPMRAPAAAPVDEASATLSPAGGGGETAAPSVRLLELFDLDDDILLLLARRRGKILYSRLVHRGDRVNCEKQNETQGIAQSNKSRQQEPRGPVPQPRPTSTHTQACPARGTAVRNGRR